MKKFLFMSLVFVFLENFSFENQPNLNNSDENSLLLEHTKATSDEQVYDLEAQVVNEPISRLERMAVCIFVLLWIASFIKCLEYH